MKDAISSEERLRSLGYGRIKRRRISPQIIHYVLEVIAMILFAVLCYAAFVIVPCLK